MQGGETTQGAWIGGRPHSYPEGINLPFSWTHSPLVSRTGTAGGGLGVCRPSFGPRVVSSSVAVERCTDHLCWLHGAAAELQPWSAWRDLRQGAVRAAEADGMRLRGGNVLCPG